MAPLDNPPSITEWKRWGERDPMFGVATVPGRDTGGDRPWTAEEFYRMGEKEVSVFLSMWADYLGEMPSGTLVEIGCGAGRLTRALAKHFRQILATDISEGMLKLAREHAGRNVILKLGDGRSLPFDSNAADAGFSYIVFQHMDGPEMIASYVRELARVLRPGGSVMLHIPAVVWTQRLRQLLGLYALRRQITLWRSSSGFVPPRQKRFYVTMNYRMYSEPRIREMLHQSGFENVREKAMPGSDKRGTFYFAQLPASAGVPA